jgi:hypothetical protein
MAGKPDNEMAPQRMPRSKVAALPQERTQHSLGTIRHRGWRPFLRKSEETNLWTAYTRCKTDIWMNSIRSERGCITAS